MGYWVYQINGEFYATCSYDYRNALRRHGIEHCLYVGSFGGLTGAKLFSKRNGMLYADGASFCIPIYGD